MDEKYYKFAACMVNGRADTKGRTKNIEHFKINKSLWSKESKINS